MASSWSNGASSCCRVVDCGWRCWLAGCAETIGYERHPTPTAPAPHQTPTPTPTLLPPVANVPAIPPEIEQAAAEWPLPGKDYGNTRYTTDSTINASNVNQLGTGLVVRPARLLQVGVGCRRAADCRGPGLLPGPAEQRLCV